MDFKIDFEDSSNVQTRGKKAAKKAAKQAQQAKWLGSGDEGEGGTAGGGEDGTGGGGGDGGSGAGGDGGGDDNNGGGDDGNDWAFGGGKKNKKKSKKQQEEEEEQKKKDEEAAGNSLSWADDAIGANAEDEWTAGFTSKKDKKKKGKKVMLSQTTLTNFIVLTVFREQKIHHLLHQIHLGFKISALMTVRLNLNSASAAATRRRIQVDSGLGATHGILDLLATLRLPTKLTTRRKRTRRIRMPILASATIILGPPAPNQRPRRPQRAASTLAISGRRRTTTTTSTLTETSETPRLLMMPGGFRLSTKKTKRKRKINSILIPKRMIRGLPGVVLPRRTKRRAKRVQLRRKYRHLPQRHLSLIIHLLSKMSGLLSVSVKRTRRRARKASSRKFQSRPKPSRSRNQITASTGGSEPQRKTRKRAKPLWPKSMRLHSQTRLRSPNQQK